MIDYDGIVTKLRGLKWMVHDEMRGLVTDTTAYGAATAIETLRAEVEALKLQDAASSVTIADLAGHRDGLLSELTATKERLAEAVEVIGPFAKAGRIRLCGGDDYWTGEKSIQGTDLAFHVKFMDLRNASTFLAKQEPKPMTALREGFVPHDGHICPVEVEQYVDYITRDGWRSDGPVLAGLLRWDKGRTPESAADESLRRRDIIAYRPTQQELSHD